MSKSRLLSGRVPKKSGADLDASRYDFLDLASTEPDLGQPNFDGALLISQADGTRLWSNNIRVDLTGNIAVGTISSADGSSAIAMTDDVVIEDNLIVQGIFFAPIISTQTINTIDSSDLRIESGLIVEGNLVVQGTTTTINSTTLVIEDKNIELAKGATSASEANGAGITVLGPETPASLIYDADIDGWIFNKNINANLVGDVTGNIYTNRIDSPDSSEITVNSSVSIDGDLRVNNDINAEGTVYAERVFVRDTIFGNFEGAITGPEATGLFQQLITAGIDSLDSSPIRFIPAVILESDLTVENNIYADQDITAQRNVTAENFYGTLRGNVNVDFGISDFNDIRIKGVLIGDVLTAISAGNLKGDVLSENGVKILENGTDGTDAAFTGSVTGDIYTNRIESPDSSEITIDTSVSVDGDLRVSSDINTQGTVYAERVFVRDTIVGTFEGAITGPEATGLFQQLITNGLDSLDSSPIRFIPGIVVESDLTVENNAYFQNDVTVTRDVTAQRFVGFLQGQVSDISNHSIGELSDVDISTLPLNNQTLVWNVAQNKFVPGDSFSQADFDTAFGNKSIGDLSDVDITTTAPADGQPLVWDTAEGKFVPGQALGTGSSVSFTSITADIFTTSIDSPDSTAITVVPSVIMNSDLSVENNVYVTVDVTARKFIGDFVGDVLAQNGTRILESGTDGSDAVFTGSVIGQVSDISNHSIDELSDVDITTAAPSNGQTIVWNSSISKFVPGGQGVGTTDNVTFNSLTLQSLEVSTIDSQDSAAITFVPEVIMNSDLTVENNVYVTVDVTARKFLGDVYAQIVKSEIGEFDNIVVNGVQIGVIQGSTKGDLIGDILAEDGTKILENGTDGTDARFSGLVIGSVVGQVSDISNHSIGSLNDVDITTAAPSNGQTLVWNAGLSKFVPGDQSLSTTADVTFNSLTLQNLDVVTIGSADSSSISVVNSTVFASDVTVDNNLIVQGNLTVLGTETIINTVSLVVNDPVIFIAGNNEANILDMGFVGTFNDGLYHQHTGLIRDASDNIWRLFSNYIPEPQEPFDFTNVTYDDLRLGTLEANQVNAQYIYGEIITSSIDSADSSSIQVIPKLVTKSDLEVQNSLTVSGTAIIDESVTSPLFIGTLQGTVTDISNHSLGDLGDVDFEFSIPQDLDILTWNAGVQKWVASGLSNQGLFTTSDVTFASLTANIFTNYITSPDSSEVVVANRLVGTHDIVAENNIYSQNDIIATRNVEAEKFVGYLDGLARDIDDTAITNKEFITELDINLDQVFVYDVSAGQLKKTYLSDIVSSGAAGYTGSQGEQGYTGSQGDLGYTGSIGFTGSQGGTLFDFSVVGSAYRVAGLQGDFPIINLTRGQLYYFDFSDISSSNPLALRLETGDTSVIPGTESNDPVSGTNGNLVVYRVPLDAPNSIVYQGTADSNWVGLINIFDQVGYTGSAGFTGSFGFTGSQGDLGYTGSAGVDGYTGSKGEDGTSVKIVGIVATANDLPDPYNGDVGDGYIVMDTGNLWTWSGTTWIEVGRILGYTGSQGPAGGYTGSKGDPGVAASFTTRAYTGDGSTTEFEITAGNTIQTVLVFLNGVNQRPTDDYTVAGSILTFTTAPSAGELIIIREMPQAATGYTGSRGTDGLGILDVDIVDDDLVITYQDSTQDNVGRVVGYTGSQGIPGEAAAIGYTGSQGPQGASTEIKGSVATEADLPGNGRTFVFQSPGGYYTIDGIPGNNPQITLVRGRTYVFNFEAITSDYPIALRIVAGNIVPVPGTTGNDPQNGVYGSGAIVTYIVPLDAQSSIVYQSPSNPTMIGTISIINETASNDIGDGYIVETTGDLWFWNGTQWNNVGKITGDMGPRGYTGSRGTDGQGILDVDIVDDDLVITYQDSTQENVGRVVGYTGSKGLGLDPWTKVTTNYTAESGNRIIADTTAGPFTLTLPPNPSLGSYVVLTDGGDWGVNPLTISANGVSIEGILNDIGLDIGGITLEFLWDGDLWHITATLGTEGAPGIGVPDGGTTGQVLAKASNDDYDTVWVNAATGGGNLGSLVINGSRITTSDSSQIVVDERFKIEQDLTMGGDIIPTADSQFDLGSASNKWRSLYVSSDTIFINDVALTVNQGGELLVNGSAPSSSVPSITAINDVVLSSPTVGQVLGFTGSVWTNQSVAASQVARFINLTIAGEINPPRIGQFRFYPPQSIVITRIYASISAQAQGGAFVFQINKNGVNTGVNLSIAEGFFTMTAVNANITVNSSDYLTVDVTGVGSRDLHIKLEYEPAS